MRKWPSLACRKMALEVMGIDFFFRNDNTNVSIAVQLWNEMIFDLNSNKVVQEQHSILQHLIDRKHQDN